MTLLSLQLMTNRQNEYDYLTEGTSLTFFVVWVRYRVIHKKLSHKTEDKLQKKKNEDDLAG